MAVAMVHVRDDERGRSYESRGKGWEEVMDLKIIRREKHQTRMNGEIGRISV